MNIPIKQIKKLRAVTGAGVMDVKKALEESQGNEEKAKAILQKMGFEKADKKRENTTSAGIVETYIHNTGTSGATVVLTTETDFVARNRAFHDLAREIAMQITAMKPQDTEELLKQEYIRDPQKTIEELIKENIAKFGENIRIKDFKRFEV